MLFTSEQIYICQLSNDMNSNCKDNTLSNEFYVYKFTKIVECMNKYKDELLETIDNDNLLLDYNYEKIIEICKLTNADYNCEIFRKIIQILNCQEFLSIFISTIYKKEKEKNKGLQVPNEIDIQIIINKFSEKVSTDIYQAIDVLYFFIDFSEIKRVEKKCCLQNININYNIIFVESVLNDLIYYLRIRININLKIKLIIFDAELFILNLLNQHFKQKKCKYRLFENELYEIMSTIYDLNIYQLQRDKFINICFFFEPISIHDRIKTLNKTQLSDNSFIKILCYVDSFFRMFCIEFKKYDHAKSIIFLLSDEFNKIKSFISKKIMFLLEKRGYVLESGCETEIFDVIIKKGTNKKSQDNSNKKGTLVLHNKMKNEKNEKRIYIYSL